MNDRKARKTVKILGVGTDSTSKDRVLRYIQSSLKNNHKFIITTPNPEIVMKAQEDELLKKAINDSDIRLTDGIGLAYANKFLQLSAPRFLPFRLPVLVLQETYLYFSLLIDPNYLTQDLTVIKGREMFMDLVQLSNKKKLKIYLLGGRDESATLAQKELTRRYKGVQIESSSGPILDEDGNAINQEQKDFERSVIEDINHFNPDLLFIGFGAPKQERWIYKWIHNLEIGGAMVVGGTFDSVAGVVKPAPKWISEANFEWLWRLFMQPKRIKRIVNAVIVFPWKLFLYKLNNRE